MYDTGLALRQGIREHLVRSRVYGTAFDTWIPLPTLEEKDGDYDDILPHSAKRYVARHLSGQKHFHFKVRIPRNVELLGAWVVGQCELANARPEQVTDLQPDFLY